jgi:hypothetical protein
VRPFFFHGKWCICLGSTETIIMQQIKLIGMGCIEHLSSWIDLYVSNDLGRRPHTCLATLHMQQCNIEVMNHVMCYGAVPTVRSPQLVKRATCMALRLISHQIWAFFFVGHCDARWALRNGWGRWARRRLAYFFLVLKSQNFAYKNSNRTWSTVWMPYSCQHYVMFSRRILTWHLQF